MSVVVLMKAYVMIMYLESTVKVGTKNILLSVVVLLYLYAVSVLLNK